MRRAKIQTEDGTILRAYLLMIIAEHDRCTFTEVQRAVYEAAPEPNKLLSFDDEHFDAYTMFFERTGPPARDWFVEHLGMPRGSDAPGARESVSSTISN